MICPIFTAVNTRLFYVDEGLTNADKIFEYVVTASSNFLYLVYSMIAHGIGPDIKGLSFPTMPATSPDLS